MTKFAHQGKQRNNLSLLSNTPQQLYRRQQLWIAPVTYILEAIRTFQS